METEVLRIPRHGTQRGFERSTWQLERYIPCEAELCPVQRVLYQNTALHTLAKKASLCALILQNRASPGDVMTFSTYLRGNTIRHSSFQCKVYSLSWPAELFGRS